jgi:molybdopterin-guanine dinucleotide biosynthesis protein A
MHCDTEYLVTAPCDSPFLPHDLVARLGAALEQNDAELTIAVTGAGEHRQKHPVFCIMKSALRPRLTAFLQKGGRKVSEWHATLRVAEVHFADEAPFSNINTLDELRSLEKI